MILINFKHSRSKKFPGILKLAKNFERFTENEDQTYTVDVQLKEVFEKWEWFNELYWPLTELKGTTISYNGMTYYGKTDQRKIFYALQQSKYNQINKETFKLVQLHKRYEGNEIENVRIKNISDEMMDDFLDNINKIGDDIN